MLCYTLFPETVTMCPDIVRYPSISFSCGASLDGVALLGLAFLMSAHPGLARSRRWCAPNRAQARRCHRRGESERPRKWRAAPEGTQ